MLHNCCLDCFLKQQSFSTLTFLGELEVTKRYTLYRSIDPQGFIWVSSSKGATNDVRQSEYHTVVHWGFPVPETYSFKGVEKQLDHVSWHIYGKFQEEKVIVMEYRETYGAYLGLAFLSYKGWGTVMLDKHRKAIQELFRKARVQANATHQLYDSDLYPTIAALANEEYLKSLPKETHESKA